MTQLSQYSVKSHNEVCAALANLISKQLKNGKKVVWFVSGGSSISIASLALGMIDSKEINNLFVTLVDDKFGVELSQTNGQQFMHLLTGLHSQQFQGIVDLGKDLDIVTDEFLELVTNKMEWADITIGQFGIGEGFHTGGILANSPAVHSDDLVCSYSEYNNTRITITPKLIKQLNYAFVNSMGEGKRVLVAHFIKSQALIEAEPTQALKEAKNCLLYSDVLPED